MGLSKTAKSVGVVLFSVLAVSAHAGTISLGSASAFGVLGEAGVTNTGPSTIDGSVSGSTGTPSVTGFPPGAVVPGTGVLYTTGPGSSTPFDDATAAYNEAAGQATTEILTGTDLGGLTLDPGVYLFSSSAQLTGMLTLDAQRSDDASWTFVIGSALTTASASGVQLVDAGSDGEFTGSITWAVGSEASLGATTAFLGTILSNAASTLGAGATVGCGGVISLDAAVTLNDNTIDATPGDCVVSGATLGPPSPPASATPEPGALVLLPCGLLAMAFLKFRGSRASR
jgi:hypothetical protein